MLTLSVQFHDDNELLATTDWENTQWQKDITNSENPLNGFIFNRLQLHPNSFGKYRDISESLFHQACIWALSRYLSDKGMDKKRMKICRQCLWYLWICDPFVITPSPTPALGGELRAWNPLEWFPKYPVYSKHSIAVSWMYVGMNATLVS